MENHLEQLEVSVHSLVRQFKILMNERESLSEELAFLRKEREQVEARIDAVRADLQQQYEVRVTEVEKNLQAVIDELRQEKEKYEGMVRQAVGDIQSLLSRLPSDHAEES